MSYRHAYDNGMGGVEYERIETPDEDYDRMIQEQLDDEAEGKEAHDSDPARTER